MQIQTVKKFTAVREIVDKTDITQTTICDCCPINGIRKAQMWILAHQDPAIKNTGQRMQCKISQTCNMD